MTAGFPQAVGCLAGPFLQWEEGGALASLRSALDV